MTNQSLGRADMHMHTNVSDGASTVQEVLQHIQTLKLDVIAITDHDRLDASLWAYEHQDDYTFDIVPGIEVTSHEGHVLAWWVTEPIPSNMTLEETVQAIHEAGGIAILAHPFHLWVEETRRGIARYWNNPQIIEAAGFDGIEVVNPGNVILGINAYAKYTLRKLNVATVGNSDAHTLTAIGSAGTRFPGKTAHELKQAILEKKTKPIGGYWSIQAYWEYVSGTINGSIQCEPIQPKQA